MPPRKQSRASTTASSAGDVSVTSDRPPARRAAARAARRRVIESDDEADEDAVKEEDEEEPKPKTKSKPTRSRKAVVEEEPEEEEEEEKPKQRGRKKRVSIAEPEKPKRGGRGRKPAVVEEEEEEEAVEEEQEEEDDAPVATPASPRSSASSSPGPATPRADTPKHEVVIHEEATPVVAAPVVRPPPLPPMKMEINPVVKEGEKRLVIHKIVLVNFKSYAGRMVIGPFHKSFSAIVGPNGSGKSNTIDALLFVFGFKATKMRQGKLSELIHNSAASPPGGFNDCSVEVWFREIVDLPGPDAYTIVPDSKLVVARTAFRNNTSKYTINERTSNFNEVTSLLRNRGIDLDHKRFLILQGEVESIAQMKPKAATEHEEGLLEYLEDIIGTSRFKEHIVQSLKDVETLNEERGEKLGRVRLVEREKAALEARKKEADGYLKDQNSLVRQQNALWQFYMFQADENQTVASAAVEECTTALEEDRKAQEGDIKEAEGLQKEHDEEEEKYKEVEKVTAELLKDLAAREREAVQWAEKKKHAGTKLKKLRKSVADDEHALSEAQVAIKHNGDEAVKVRTELDKHEAGLVKEEAELDKIRDSLKDKTQVFADQIEAKQAELVPWAAQVTEKKAAVDLATSERDLLLKRVEDAKVALEQAEAAVEKVKEDGKAKAAELKALSSERKQVQQGIADAEKELASMDTDDKRLRAAASSARQKAEDAKASQVASTSRGAVLAGLTKLRDQGRLRGFHGRLGDLGRIDDKYDVAISTACPQLDNLVCDTVEDGQACLEHLKRTHAGRASIFCLDKLNVKIPEGIQTPENAPRLFDLVTPRDPKFARAFYKVLLDTLVAKDLAQANRIAFGATKRWRVVTLDGKLIDSSGTMSGGGTRVARGGMSSKLGGADDSSPEVVARLEREREQADKVLEIHLNSRTEVEAELKTLRARLPELEMAITKADMAMAGGAKRIEEAKRTIAELKSRDNDGDDEADQVRALESQIAGHNKDLDQLKKKTGAIEQAIKALQDKILEVGGVRLRTQQAKVQDLKEVIDHANDRLTKAEVAKSKAERDVVKLEKALGKNRGDLDGLEAEVEELEEKMGSNEAEAEAMRQGAEQARFALEEQKESLDAIAEQLAERMKVINEFKARQAELKHRMEESKRILQQAKKTLDYWSAKHANLKLHEIMDDDDDEAEKAVEETELQAYTAEDFEDFDVEMTKAEVAKLEEDLARASPNLSVLKEYAKREAEFMSRAADLESTTQARDQAKQRLEDLNKQRLEEFMWGFHIISAKLKEMYQMITLGGNAELELVDSLDPFSEGIIFSVMPPKKSWKNISNLSGGEKTLSSLALVFALHAFKPTPLYFMDEIDAALDFRNVSIIGNYIKDRTKNAQFIIISLRNNMFELSRRLVGIYKTNNTTKSIAVDNTDLASMA